VHKFTVDLLGPTHPDVGKVMLDIAAIECETGSLKKAKDLCFDAKNIFDKEGVPKKSPYRRQLKHRMNKICLADASRS